MKRFQIGFAAVIAVLAMSFTIAEHNEVFKAKCAKAITDCFKAGGTNGLKIRSTCPTSTIIINTTDVCSKISPGDKVWSLDVDNVIGRVDISLSCPGGNTFCCVTLIEDINPCPGQPTFNIGAGAKPYKVNAVYCKI